jgi:endonuclease/exonuclease/phosphatase family metal-dependent hydrolase
MAEAVFDPVWMHNGRQRPQPKQLLWSRSSGAAATLSGIPLHRLMVSKSRSGLICALALGLSLVSGCTGGHSMARGEVAGTGATLPAVAWLGPDLTADRTSLHSWSQSVGPPVVIASGAVASAPADRLVIVNWNMHVGGGDFERLALDVRRQAGTDVPVVFLIQEAYRDGPEVPTELAGTASFASLIRSLRPDGSREEIETVARRLGLHAYYVPSMRNGGPETSAEDRGNAILSTMPLGDLGAIELPFERQRRVAVAATVTGATRTGSSWRLRVVSAHLDNMVGARRLWIAGGEFGRTRQARGLVSALAEEKALVLGGDLNTWFGFRDAAYRTAAAAFPQTRVSDRRATFHGVLRLDHLFFRLDPGWTAEFRRADDAYGSDHFPLIGEIRFQ